jgi:DNA-binding transcriptional regulator YiaG
VVDKILKLILDALNMERKEFVHIRKKLKKTQKQMAELLGTSLKAVHSYEQGWRNIPVHVERQLLFLLSRKAKTSGKPKPCWVLKKCPSERKKSCPAWEFQTGNLCWFVNGTICEGVVHADWKEKMEMCRECEILPVYLDLA